MISNLQKPIISGFDSKSDADKIVKEKDLSGKLQLLLVVTLVLALKLHEH